MKPPPRIIPVRGIFFIKFQEITLYVQYFDN